MKTGRHPPSTVPAQLANVPLPRATFERYTHDLLTIRHLTRNHQHRLPPSVHTGSHHCKDYLRGDIMERKDKKHPTPSKLDRPIQAEAYPFTENGLTPDNTKDDQSIVNQADTLKRYS